MDDISTCPPIRFQFGLQSYLLRWDWGRCQEGPVIPCEEVLGGVGISVSEGLSLRSSKLPADPSAPPSCSRLLMPSPKQDRSLGKDAQEKCPTKVFPTGS